MKTGLVFINQATNYLGEDIIKSFLNSKKYDEIIMMVGNPNNISLKDPKVKVVPICNYNKKTIKTRLKSWIVGAMQCWWKILLKYRKYDLFLTTNPPTLPFITSFLPNKFSILVYDIYPDGIAESGMLKADHPIIKMWKAFNKRMYKRAKNIYTLSEGMAERLSQYVNRNKIKIVPIWYSQDIHKISKEENTFIKENQLENKFIVLYSGNFGKKQNVDIIPDIAIFHKENDHIIFLIIGDGWAKKDIEEKIDKYKLKNVVLLPYQPAEILSHSLSSADVAIVTVDSTISTICVPSKTFNHLAVGTPILGIAEKESEIYKIVEGQKVGHVYSANDVKGMSKFIKELENNEILQRELSESALSLSKNYTSLNASKIEF